MASEGTGTAGRRARSQKHLVGGSEEAQAWLAAELLGGIAPGAWAEFLEKVARAGQALSTPHTGLVDYSLLSELAESGPNAQRLWCICRTLMRAAHDVYWQRLVGCSAPAEYEWEVHGVFSWGPGLLAELRTCYGSQAGQLLQTFRQYRSAGVWPESWWPATDDDLWDALNAGDGLTPEDCAPGQTD